MSHRPAIHVHFLVPAAVYLHFDHHRRKGSRDRCGGQQDVPEQRDRVRILAGRDRCHVPDHGLERVEIGGPDKKNATLRIFGRNLVQQGAVDIRSDDASKRPGVCQGFPKDRFDKPALLENVFLRGRRRDPLQNLIVLGTEECEGSDQRTCADACDDLELGSRAGRRPSLEEPCAVGAIVAAAGDGKKGGWRQRAAG